MNFLFVFAQSHAEFRIPELESVSELYGFKIRFIDDCDGNDPHRPFMILDLDNQEHAKSLASRCILVKLCISLFGATIWFELTCLTGLCTSTTPMETRTNSYTQETAEIVRRGSGTNLIARFVSTFLLSITRSPTVGSVKLLKVSLTWAFWGKSG
jgi:tRNA G10  N-methylase Trm11